MKITHPEKIILLLFLLVIYLPSFSNIKQTNALTTTETNWTLVKTIINPFNTSEMTSSEHPLFEGSYSTATFSDTSMTLFSHNVQEGIWGYDSNFEFSWDSPPKVLVPGSTINLKITGKATWTLNETAFFSPAYMFRFVSPICGSYKALDQRGTSSVVEVIDPPQGPGIVGLPCWENTGPATLEPTDLSSTETKTFAINVPEFLNLQTIDEDFTITIDLASIPVKWVYKPSQFTSQDIDPRLPARATFKVEPEKGNPDDEVTCIGADYPENSEVTIYWDDIMRITSDTHTRLVITSDSSGAFNVNITIPSSALKGIHKVIAEAESIKLTDDVEVVFKPIIFIPGVGGSILYQKSGLIPGELWPVAWTAGRINLALNKDGTSSHTITAPDIIRYVDLTGYGWGKEDIYGSFVETVISWGYEENKDFFVFPYDWRQDNYIHVEDLDKKIDEAIASTDQKKVVLVAHSMGGIVARAYMDRKGTDKIDSFLTMGTPHRGSVKPYYAFLMGYNFGNKLAAHKLMKVILQNCPSGYQLIPWNPFIKDESGNVWTLDESFAVHYHEVKWDPVNGYADAWNWNWFFNSEMLKNGNAFRNRLGTSAPPGIETYTIIGQGVATLSSYTAREPTFWESLGYTGIKKADGSRWVLEPDLKKDFGDGDGTVPLWSEEGLQNDKKFYIQNLPDNSAEHGHLPANTIVQALIKDIIMGEEVSVDGYPKEEFNDLEGQTGFEIHSSANLHIYDSGGNHMGVNEYGSIEEGIPGGTMISMDGYEYCSILNPEDSYDIEVIGFEEGNFTLNVVIRSDGRTVEFSYPEIEVVNGSLASFTLPDSQSVFDNLPEIAVQTEDSVLTLLPEVVEVSSIRVVAHKLCSFVDSQGEPSDFVSEYSVDEVVFSWLDIADASVGDHVHWVFNGPDSHEMVFDYTINWVGEGTTWATFSLADYENVMGPWSVDVFINGDFVSSLDFEIVDEGFKIPGFPWLSIGIALLCLSFALRSEIIIERF